MGSQSLLDPCIKSDCKERLKTEIISKDKQVVWVQMVQQTVRLVLLKHKGKRVARQRTALKKALKAQQLLDPLPSECDRDSLAAMLNEVDPLNRVIEDDAGLAHWFTAWYSGLKKDPDFAKKEGDEFYQVCARFNNWPLTVQIPCYQDPLDLAHPRHICKTLRLSSCLGLLQLTATFSLSSVSLWKQSAKVDFHAFQGSLDLLCSGT